MSKLPPPVTKKSSKADLWDEIIALRDEVDAQQSNLNNARDTMNKWKSQMLATEYQLRIIRETLSMEFK